MKVTDATGPDRAGFHEHVSTENWTEDLVAPARQSRFERVRETAEQAITRLAEALEQGRSEALTEYLGTMSRFHRYSFHNGLLIALQRPDATLVAGFRKWLELDRHVMKGEKGIAIMAPMIRRARHDTSSEDAEQHQDKPYSSRLSSRLRVRRQANRRKTSS